MMVGSYRVVIRDKHITYDFEIKRKYTVIRGNSATGKTYMYNMLLRHETEKICQVKLTALIESNWETTLKVIRNQIFFVDESFVMINSYEFAKAMSASDNYFVLITRKKLSSIPYSVSEIYELTSSKRYNNLNKPYTRTSLKPLYTEKFKPVHPRVLITEDSNSGYQFFDKVVTQDIECISAKGKDNVCKEIESRCNIDGYICVIVDGAAFGSCIDELVSLYNDMLFNKLVVLIPESFEYLILKALPKSFDIRGEFLSHTYDYCDAEHMRRICPNMRVKVLDSWEQFYTTLLMGKTHGTYLEYNKSNLNDRLLGLRDIILDEIKELLLDK